MGFSLLNLLEPVTEVVGKAMDHYLPPSMSDQEREDVKLKTQAMVSQQFQAEESSFRNFVLDYEGRAKDMPPSIQVLRASVRPLITYLITGTIAWLVWNGKVIPTELHQLALVCLTFWFGDKTVRNYLKTKQGQNVGN
jgi:hypothetical protein